MNRRALPSAGAHALLLVLPGLVARHGDLVLRPQAVVLVVLLLVLAEAEHRARRGLPDPVDSMAPGTWSARASALGLYVTVAAALGWPTVQATWSWWGVLAIATGITLRAVAIRTLGSAFTSETAAPLRVVDQGIYRFLAHPSEVGLVLVAGGAALLGASLAALGACLLMVVPSVVVRVRAEERVLRATREAFRTPGGRENPAFSSG